MSVDKSSSAVAHEAEDTRAHLASTLQQLRDNLRPENVMEEVVTNARAGASQVADNLAGVAKRYPIPAVLVAAGSALIMRFFNGKADGIEAGPAVTRAGLPRPPMLRNPSTFTPAPGRGPSADAHLDDLRRSGGTTIQPSSSGRQLRGTYASTSSQAGDTMQSLSNTLPKNGREAKSRLSNLLEEQPLILGVIGLAVGAAIGAALPITETEEHLMGGTSHRLRDSASDAARHEIDGLRAAAGEAVQNVRHSATENLHGFVKDVGDNARTVVGKAGDSLNHGNQDV